MQVRIQLIRDDGSVVLNLSGNAAGSLAWNATHDPLAQIAVEPGVYLEAFVYKPSVLRSTLE